MCEKVALVQAERLSAILQMVSGLAHESRNALQRAHACLELLELGLTDDAEQLRLTARIRAALSDLYQNYEDVRDYASPIALQRAPIDLRKLCQSVFDELVAEVGEANADLRFNADCGGQPVLADGSQMKVVFRNVLDNAIAARRDVAIIDVACQPVTVNGHSAVRMSFRDHGPGIDPSIADQVLEPFITTKQRGTGLGLAVCQRIVEAHGGFIDAENHRGGGAVVRITLPI